MWPRKQLDIGWRDLAAGIAAVLLSHRRPRATEIVPEAWIPPDECLLALSVRSGWDLLLSALRLPAGSEVLMTAVTIPDMVRVARHHGLVPVPLAVDAEGLGPDIGELERRVTPATRIVLVAHLFGSRMRMEPVIRLARRRGLLVVEDCAQAYVGNEYAGHVETDCSLFSFGPIKTATALGGAVLRVRNGALRARMAAIQDTYGLQSRRSYGKRLIKYAGLRLLQQPRIYALFMRVLRRRGIDPDEALGNAVHSFAADDLIAQLRRRPCAALLRVLQRRLRESATIGAEDISRRAARGRGLARVLPARTILGYENLTHSYWVVPVRVPKPEKLVDSLRRAGFDATMRSSMAVVPEPSGEVDREAAGCDWLRNVVYLPNGDSLPDAEWHRLTKLVAEQALAGAAGKSTEPATTERVLAER